MGKALIVRHIGDGQYDVTYMLDVARARANLEAVAREIMAIYPYSD